MLGVVLRFPVAEKVGRHVDVDGARGKMHMTCQCRNNFVCRTELNKIVKRASGIGGQSTSRTYYVPVPLIF